MNHREGYSYIIISIAIILFYLCVYVYLCKRKLLPIVFVVVELFNLVFLCSNVGVGSEINRQRRATSFLSLGFYFLLYCIIEV